MELISQFKTPLDQEETALLTKAYDLARQAHQHQKRFSGEPYFIHPLATAEILIRLNLDPEVIAAGLLHDVIEDAGIAPEKIEKEFGRNIRLLVEGVSKVSKLRLRQYSKNEFVENLRHFFLVVAKDARVVFVKLADRLHNMRTLEYVPKHKRERIARETLEIYAPLADRLGIGEIKGELEDLAFPYVYPKEYQWIKKEAAPYYQTAKDRLEVIQQQLRQRIKQESIDFTLQARTKHLYSLYRKLLLWDKDFSKIYDIIALRVIVNSVENCYAVLGIVHQMWKPLLGRIKDYIAQPKANGYQSLHTTVIGNGGCIFEIQIRTEEMHQVAERGLAAHWNYAEAKRSAKNDRLLKSGVNPAQEKINWVNTLLGWEEGEDPSEFLDAVKNDLLNKRIFVFTPEGDVINLPINATPVDFAYAIHGEIGDCCAGAKIDGKMSPLSAKLENGQLVEIIKGKNKKPNPDWLDFVVTVGAKRKIRQYIRRKRTTSF